MNPKIGLYSSSLITKKSTCNFSIVLVDWQIGRYRFTQGMVSMYGYPTELAACHMGLTVPQLLTFWPRVSYFPSIYVIAGTLVRQCRAKYV